MFSVTSIIFAMTGAAIIYLFQQKRKQLSRLEISDFPELSQDDFNELKQLLKTAYERTLYMGVLFLPLAYAARENGEKVSQLFFLILIGLLFISNIFPRNKVMKLLEANELTMRILQDRGVRL